MATTYVSSTRLTASGVSFPVEKGWKIPIVVKNPDPGSATSTDVISVVVAPTSGPHILGANVAAHFLDQAAFGPDFATLDHVETVGLESYLKEQFAAPISPYPDPATTGFGINQVQARFFTNAVHGQDQLRQRVAFALGPDHGGIGDRGEHPDSVGAVSGNSAKGCLRELSHAHEGCDPESHHG